MMLYKFVCIREAVGDLLFDGVPIILPTFLQNQSRQQELRYQAPLPLANTPNMDTPTIDHQSKNAQKKSGEHEDSLKGSGEYAEI